VGKGRTKNDGQREAKMNVRKTLGIKGETPILEPPSARQGRREELGGEASFCQRSGGSGNGRQVLGKNTG